MAKAGWEVLWDRLGKAISYALVEFDMSRPEALGVLDLLRRDLLEATLPGDPEGEDEAELDDEEDEA